MKLLVALYILHLHAAPVPSVPAAGLMDRLEQVRIEIRLAEKAVSNSLKDEKQAKNRLVQVRRLQLLQYQEIKLLRERRDKLEAFVLNLEKRKSDLHQTIEKKKQSLRSQLIALKSAHPRALEPDQVLKQAREKMPLSELLERLSARSMRELEMLKIDLEDAKNLNQSIIEERQQIHSLLQDLSAQQALLEFQKSLEADVLRQRSAERMAQWEQIQKLRQSEHEVDELLKRFNARLELERLDESKKQVPEVMGSALFAAMKGRLVAPIESKIRAGFGKSIDALTQLEVFKKGIDFEPKPSGDVYALFSGVVAFSGKIPTYGTVLIIDHGANYYSLLGRLSEVGKKVGDRVIEREVVGKSGTESLYLELRFKNTPLNPSEWIALAN